MQLFYVAFVLTVISDRLRYDGIVHI